MVNVSQEKSNKYGQIIERLNALEALDVVDQFEFKRIQKLAEALKADAGARGTGYFILGALCSLEFDLDGVHRNFKASLATIDKDNYIVTLANQASNLLNIYQFKESTEILCDLHNSNRDDAFILSSALKAVSISFAIEKWSELYEHAEKLAIDPYAHHVFSSFGSDTHKKAIARAESMNVPLSKISELVQCAADYLFSRKLRFAGSLTHILQSGEISYQFFLYVSADEAAQISLDLAMHLIENFEDPNPDLITISCLPK